MEYIELTLSNGAVKIKTGSALVIMTSSTNRELQGDSA
jgi:hypothetical protein